MILIARTHSIVVASPPGGRLGHHFRGVAAALATAGHQVRFVVPHPRRRTLTIEGVSVSAWADGSRAARMAEMTRSLRAWRPDLVVISFGDDIEMLLAATAARVPRRALFHHTGTRAIALDLGEVGPLFHLRVRRRMWAYRTATDILCASRHVADELIAAGVPSARVQVVPLAIHDPGTAARTRAPGSVVSVGRLETSKGFESLIRALPLLDTTPTARLTILGEGAQRARLEHLVADLGLEDRCSLPGHVHDPARIDQALREAHVACFPSIDEGFGIAAVEAMAAATPLVATDIGSFRELRGGDPAVAALAAPGDPSSLARELRRALAREDRAPHGAAARDRFERAYSMSTQTDRLRDAYLGLLG